MATSYYTKRAVKGTGGPIGFPQPVRWIDCGCGRCVPRPNTIADVTCECGNRYDCYGWIRDAAWYEMHPDVEPACATLPATES
jgi:hypothetical protein